MLLSNNNNTNNNYLVHSNSKTNMIATNLNSMNNNNNNKVYKSSNSNANRNLKNKSLSSSMSSSSTESASSSASSSSLAFQHNLNQLDDQQQKSTLQPYSNYITTNKNGNIEDVNFINPIQKPSIRPPVADRARKNEQLLKIVNQQFPQNHQSLSYTYQTYDPNRLSSYDNHDFNEFLNNFNNSNNISHSSKMDTLPAYMTSSCTNRVRTSIACPNETLNHHSKVDNNISSSKKSSNLFTRAINYAKRTASSSNSNTNYKTSWKSKLGKYLNSSTTNLPDNTQIANNRKSHLTKYNYDDNDHDGCDIILDDDLYSSGTYHLSRKNMLNIHNSVNAAASKNNNRSSYINLNTLLANNNGTVVQQNQSKQLVIPSSSSSSSSSELATSSPSYSSPLSSSNDIENNSRGKSVDNKTSTLVKQQQQQQVLNDNRTSIINNGFTSLRKILKMPSSTSTSFSSQSNNKKSNSKNIADSNNTLTKNIYNYNSSPSYDYEDDLNPNLKNNRTKTLSFIKTSTPQLTTKQNRSSSNSGISDHATNLTTSHVVNNERDSSTIINSKFNKIKNEQNSTNNKVINMLKLYKNVLNKMQTKSKSSSFNTIAASCTLNNKSLTSKTCHLINKPFNCGLQAKDGNESTSTISGYFRPASPIIHNTNPKNKKTKQSLLASSKTNSSSLLITKTQSYTNLVDEEELMCDLEVASFFDKNQKSTVPQTTEDNYFYYQQEQYNNDNNEYDFEDDYNINHEPVEFYDSEDDYSKNLEYLVQQLAVEASLSNFDLSNIYNSNNNNNNNNTNSKAAPVIKSLYVDSPTNMDVEKLVDNLNNKLKYTNHDDDDEDEDSLDKSSIEFSQANSELVVCNKNIDKLEQFDTDSLLNQSRSTSPIENLNNGSNNKVNFSNSLLVKPNRLQTKRSSSSFSNSVSLNNNTTNSNIIRNNNSNHNYLYYPTKMKQYNQISSNTNGNPNNNLIRNSSNYCSTNAIPQLMNSSASSTFNNNKSLTTGQSSTLFPQKTNNTMNNNDNSNSIKIEKKIRLNYRKPQNINNLLNFGTLC